jgi:putative ABC transport system substrate-binding protein
MCAILLAYLFNKQSTKEGTIVHRLLLFALMLLCVWITSPVYAASLIQIVSAKTTDTEALSRYLSKNITSDTQIIVADNVNLTADLLIVLNKEYLETLPKTRPPTLFVLPQPVAIELNKEDSALYWTPSLAMQLALIKAILPAVNRIGMLVGDSEDLSWLRIFRQYAKEQNIDVIIQQVDKGRIGRQVSELAISTDVLLAQPDSTIYNRETIRFILLAAYRQNKALIGPSLAFVNAGALATLYSLPDSINHEIVQRIHYFLAQKKLPSTGRIKKMEIGLNEQVAKSLGLAFLSIPTLKEKISVEEVPIWP